jgi:hypothetical protein
VGLVYDPIRLTGVMTVRPGVPGVLQQAVAWRHTVDQVGIILSEGRASLVRLAKLSFIVIFLMLE